jgi:MerR family copper efflux transcriptional regulator
MRMGAEDLPPIDIGRVEESPADMRIGELAEQVGVSRDTIRFYERSGWLPRPVRSENAYREYSAADAEHLRLIIDLRRLEIPLEDAARIATWCHSGHCRDTSTALPSLIGTRRAAIADRIADLRALDARLADLEVHLADAPRTLAVIDGGGAPCCAAAEAVVGSAEGACACCVTTSAVEPLDRLRGRQPT